MLAWSINLWSINEQPKLELLNDGKWEMAPTILIANQP